MTKQKEIDILRQAVDSLGSDSYLGPALSRLIPWAESQIRSDIDPDLVSELRRTEAEITENMERIKVLRESISAQERNLRAIEERYADSSARFQTVKNEIKALYSVLR